MDPAIVAGVVVGAIFGFAIAYIWRGKEITLERKSWEERKSIWEQGQTAQNQLKDTFNAIAEEVLRTHSKDFSEKAATSEKSVEKLVENMDKALKTVQTKIEDYEKNNKEQIGTLSAGIKHVLDVGSKMQDTALSLKSVLSSSSGVRGRWGEAVLKNILEDSGLTEGVDFTLQTTISGDESAKLRPDVVINLPGGLRLAVDSKAGLDAFFRAVEEKDEDKRKEHIAKFAQDLRGHITKLSSKEYQSHLDKKIPYVVMFVPGEAAVRAAFEQDVNLYREAQSKKIMLASPATIIPLVMLIAHAWKQQKSADNASKIITEVVNLGSRMKVFLGHITNIGESLRSATKTFNSAAGSWDSRVRPQIDRINTLAGHAQIENVEIPQIEEEPRLQSKEEPPLLEKPALATDE